VGVCDQVLSSTKVHASFLRDARDLPGEMTIVKSEDFPAMCGRSDYDGQLDLPLETLNVPEKLMQETSPFEVQA